MSDTAGYDVQEGIPEPVTNDAHAQNSATEAPPPVSAEELVKMFAAEDTAHILTELLRGQQIASVYIDARSGGVFFGGEAHITGDVAGHGQLKRTMATASGTPENVAAGQVLIDDLRKVCAVYVKPDLYAQAQQVLVEKQVLVLWGQAHWGKWTTALHLLSTLHGEKVFEIKPDVKLEELRSLAVEPGHGYVIDTLAPESAEGLDTFALNRLSARFGEQQSHLVITVDSRVSLDREALAGRMVMWRDPPNPTQVLEKHLAWYLTDRDMIARSRELMQDDEMKQLLDTHLLPGGVDRLAELLAEVARGRLELAEALTRFEARARQQVEEWFRVHTELEERTFMLSLAVFSGASYQAVTDANEQLQLLLQPQKTPEESPVANSVFGSTRSQRVAEACAHLSQGYEAAEFGRNPIELVVLDNPSFQPAVLNHIWHEYDRLRRFLLDWLRGFGFHSSFDVRARAAAAAGELSKYGFGYIREQILLPWANHGSNQVRAAAALALGIPAWDGHFAPQVLGLLHHWSTLRNNWRLSWTAAAAYGGLVGLRFPDTALRDLYTIVQAEDLRLLGILSQSVASLFQAGQAAPEYYIKVLDALAAWTADAKGQIVTLTGLMIFLELALSARVKADPEGDTWPTLLWLVRESDLYRDRIEVLWRRALNAKPARRSALETLHQWLRMADNDMRLYSPIGQLITALATQGVIRDRERLYYYLDQWALYPKEECPSAAKILATLSRS